ncbi:hypothetical protein COV19_00140 [Candidatus Woesearchaeota archaeon CG10_big_fil_rev_8_21_14_0_10_44_13]|nr:MAG: hypothetical protein COV19_00140 [Candidatus Woesearchaeota archaeon CG10_big_fil_rev_8_21_14_0_10_44_13]
MRRLIKFSLLMLVGLILITLSISASSSSEIDNLDTSFKELTMKQITKGIIVEATEEEKAVTEQLEITNPRQPYSLGFVSETFTPTEKIDNKIYSKINESPSLQITNITPEYIKNNYTYGFIMILGKTREEKIDTLENMGVKLLGYHSYHSYKAKIPLNKINELEQLPFVKWIGYSTNKQKFDTVLNSKFDDKKVGL